MTHNRSAEGDVMTAVRQGSYDAFAKALHWLTVLLIVAQYAVIWSVPDGPAADAPEVQWLWTLHASLGITLLIVMAVRFINRWINPPPAYPADMPAIQAFAAHAVHFLLYAAIIAQSILGWLTLNAYSGPFSFYWLFDVPALTAIDAGIKRSMGGLHGLLATVILILLGIHVAAALFHGIVKRDGVLSSMAR
jgi:cytochrome b561